MRAVLVVVLLAGLAMPVLGESSPLELTYEALTVEGPLQGGGQLQAFELAPTKGREAPSAFRLEAAELRVHAMHDATLYAPGGVVANQPAASDSSRFFDAVVDGHHLAPDFYLAVVPRPHLELPRILVQGNCVAARPAPSEPWTPFAYATPRDWLDVTSDVDQAFDLDDCGQIQSIRVQGHFVLTHWKWQHQVAGKDEDGRATTQTLSSGYEAEETSAVGTSTQVYLVVTDGILDVSLGEAKQPLLFLSQPSLTGQDLLLRGRILDASMDWRPAGGQFKAQGMNEVAFAWGGDSQFGVHVTGEAASLTQPATHAARVVQRHAEWVAWLIAGSALALFILGVCKPWLRPWTYAGNVLDQAKEDLRTGHNYSAAWVAQYAAWRGASRGRAYEIIAQARANLMETEAALKWFSRASRHLTTAEDLARVDYGAALAAAKGDMPEEAADRLFRAASLDPERLNQARTSSDFDAVKDHPAVQAVLQDGLLRGQGDLMRA